MIEFANVCIVDVSHARNLSFDSFFFMLIFYRLTFWMCPDTCPSLCLYQHNLALSPPVFWVRKAWQLLPCLLLVLPKLTSLTDRGNCLKPNSIIYATSIFQTLDDSLLSSSQSENFLTRHRNLFSVWLSSPAWSPIPFFVPSGPWRSKCQDRWDGTCQEKLPVKDKVGKN